MQRQRRKQDQCSKWAGLALISSGPALSGLEKARLVALSARASEEEARRPSDET